MKMWRRGALAGAVVLAMTGMGLPAAAAPADPVAPGDHVPLSVSPLACSSIPANHDPNVIKVVYQVGLDRSVSPKVMLAAFEAGWVESHMNNLNCGDKDSLGVFQQRPSQGWGTPEQIMNVSYAATQFYVQAQRNEPLYPNYTAGLLAQSVQRSCCPERYDQAEAKARAMMDEARGLVGGARAFTGSPTDFNGDGKDDIITFNQGTLGDVYVALSNGSGFAGTSVKWHDWFAPGGETPLTGDFNGDGKDDIVTFTHGSLNDVYVALSNGSAFGAGVKWHDFFGLGGEVPAVGDVNGDGKDDIITFTRNNLADVYVALSTGTSFAASVKWHDYFGLAGEVPGVGDVNGDGKADIVVFTNNAAADVYVALSNGSGFTGTTVKWHEFFSVGGESPRIGDFNGDGKADIATFTNNAAADVYVALSNGSAFTGTTVKWNDFFALGGEFPYTGDFDGDGKDDVVTFTKGSLNDVYVGLSNGSGFAGGAKWHDFFGLNGEITL
jgi:hypothetical protein